MSSIATAIEGVAHNGKPCRILDTTASVPQHELHQLLEALIRERQFGTRFSGGSGGVSVDAPRFSHIQLNGELYRLLLFRYEARIEKF